MSIEWEYWLEFDTPLDSGDTLHRRYPISYLPEIGASVVVDWIFLNHPDAQKVELCRRPVPRTEKLASYSRGDK